MLRNLIEGKRGLVIGIANEHSTAAGCARASVIWSPMEDVGNMAVGLVSDAARNVTGNIAFVDAGYHVMA
jgi:enoyl-[acyl-carrier-protein] reductase (NADH)